MMQDHITTHEDHDALISLLHHKGTAVYGIDGIKIGAVSDHSDADYLVVKTGFLWLTRDIYIPPDAIAGSDDRSIYLKYSRAEIMSLYPERPEHHPNIETVLDEARQRSAADVERETRTQSAEHHIEPNG